MLLALLQERRIGSLGDADGVLNNVFLVIDRKDMEGTVVGLGFGDDSFELRALAERVVNDQYFVIHRILLSHSNYLVCLNFFKRRYRAGRLRLS